MLLEWIAEAVRAHGAVTSALVLALVTYAIKFTTFRQINAVDWIVAATEVPATTSGTCCSLLIASLYLPNQQGRLVAVYLMVTLLVFLLNVGVYRYVENRKLALSSIRGRTMTLIAISYIFTVVVGIFAATSAYEGVNI